MALAVSGACEEICWKQEEYSVICVKNWYVTQKEPIDLDE